MPCLAVISGQQPYPRQQGLLPCQRLQQLPCIYLYGCDILCLLSKSRKEAGKERNSIKKKGQNKKVQKVRKMHGKLDGKEFKMGTVQIGHMDCKSGVFNMPELNNIYKRTNQSK